MLLILISYLVSNSATYFLGSIHGWVFSIWFSSASGSRVFSCTLHGLSNGMSIGGKLIPMIIRNVSCLIPQYLSVRLFILSDPSTISQVIQERRTQLYDIWLVSISRQCPSLIIVTAHAPLIAPDKFVFLVFLNVVPGAVAVFIVSSSAWRSNLLGESI